MGSSGHEEGTLRVFWAWVEGATGNIALALEGLVEQVRSWATLGGLGASYIMDTLNTLLVGWMIFVALILIIGTFFYYKFINHFESSDFGRPQDTQPQGELQEKKQVKETRAASGKSGPAAPPVPPAKKPTIVPDRAEEPVSPPVATGADPDAVRWTNNVFTWLYNSVDGAPAIKKTWLHTINENTVKTALETGILVEVVEIYKTSPAPALYNMVVDCSPTDSMTITCDCDATIYLRLGTTRTQGDKTTESEYACAVRPLRGRLNIAAVAPELTAVVKFDGWPEVSLKLEGIRNNAVGLDEQQMLDVIDEVLTSALRNSVLDVSFQTNKTFPRFRRARQVPDPIIPVGYDSMVRELQTHPPSAPRKQKKKNRLGSVHDEEIEEAGESFTALTFSSNLSKQINLTTSEEQLIARNLHKYPSLENSDMGDDISEFYKSWEENYVPATGVAHVDVQKVKAPVTVSQTNPKEDTKTQNFVLVASNRSKLIDEPRTADCVQEIEEEEEPELVPHLKQNVEDEPCIRRRSRSPLLLGKPKLEEPEESLELEEGENLNTLQLHKTDLVDKSLTGTSGFGPLPSLPGLQKGPFVSEACCVGVKVGVAAEVPKLELRIENAPVDDCVTCDLSECDQEVVVPIQPLLQTQLHNQPAIDDLSVYSVTDTANASSGFHRDPIPLPVSFPALEPDTFSASALSVTVGNKAENHSPVSSFVDNKNEELGLLSGYLQNTNLIKHEHVGDVSAVLVCTYTDDSNNDDARDDSFDTKILDSCPLNQDLSFQETHLEPPFCYQDSFPEEEMENANDCKNESLSKGEIHEAEDYNIQDDKLGFQNVFFKEFTENLYKQIESDESEISLPEVAVEDKHWEVVKADEAFDKNGIFSVTSDQESEEELVTDNETESRDAVTDLATDNETESVDAMSDSDEENVEEIDSNTEVCSNTDTVQDQGYESKRLYLETDIDILSFEKPQKIISLHNDTENNNTSFYYRELHYDSDSFIVTSEEETSHYDYVQLRGSGCGGSDDLSADECNLSDSEYMTSYVPSPDIDDIVHYSDDISPDRSFSNTSTIISSVAYEKLEDQQIMNETNIMSTDTECMGEETNSGPEECTEVLQGNSDTVVKLDPLNNEQWEASEGKEFSVSVRILTSDSHSNNSQKELNEKVKFPERALNESVHMENFYTATKINPASKLTSVSSLEGNVSQFNEDHACIPEDSKCLDSYTFLENSSDSEIEGITGKPTEKDFSDSPDGRSHCGQNWRNSDIDLIIEAESFVLPDDHTHPLMSYNVKNISGKDDTSSLSVNHAHVLSQNTTLNTSLDDMQTMHRDSILNENKEHTEKLPQEIPRMKAQSNILTFSEGPLLTTTAGSVDALTQPDTSCALTLQQGMSPTRKKCSTWDEVMKSVFFTSGQPQWTRPLPSYPVCGTSYVVSALSSTTTGQSTGIPGLNGKRLLVKIVKATGVGCENLVSEAYAVVEMDEPPQKFTTSIMKDTSSPFWDEQFLFDLSGSTLELLFEVYDKKNGKFLGLGIVGIEELVATPSQRQIIPLQSRPYENDEVSGSLTVEFLFLDRADLPEHTLRSSATSQSITPKGDLITTTTTTYVKAPESPDVIVNGGDGVAAAVLRDIEGKKDVVVNNASKSTMIIHASRKPDEEYLPALPVQDLTALTTTATTTTPTITTTPTHDIGTTTSLMPTTPTTTISTSTNTTNVDGTEPNETDERGRSRGSHRKRDSFFGTLKKRFSRSKVRSKSVDPSARDTSMDRDASVGRSLSAERSANLSRASDEQQVNPPSLRDTIAPRLLSVPANISGDGGSTRSSLSDASAISSSSTRTYVNEASTLIIETSENGVFKHYLIPLALQQKSKWRKKGLKLHIFGEHTFVAKHMSSSTPCEVCHKTLGRRFGKQGYVCRDCGFKCHKPCHVKTETVCPNSTINTMDLEYVKDAREERRAWIKKARAT